MEALKVGVSSSEPDLRGVEVRVEHHRAVPQADDGGSGLAVATESVRRRRRAEMRCGGEVRSPLKSPLWAGERRREKTMGEMRQPDAIPI